MKPPLIHVLTGPTAVGKTEWALRWAERNNAEIVSCDSLLFYRGMDIGTAKLSSTVGSEAWNSRDLKSRPH